jgi:hypothetical protein
MAQRLPALLVTLAMLAACSGLPTGHTNADIAGTYHATKLDVGNPNSAQNHVDYLLIGGSLNMTLNDDGTVTGQLNLPPSSLAPAVTADLTGTYTITDPEVDFTIADTSFVSVLHWTIVLNRLEASGAFAPAPGTTVTVVVSR